MDIDTQEVTLHFRRDCQDLHVLLLHSTQDLLGEEIAIELRGKLDPKIATTERGVASWDELALAVEQHQFDVLVLLAHGDPTRHDLWLYDDKDRNGNQLSINAAELTTVILGTSVSNKLCLFGVCHFGTFDALSAMWTHAGVAACIAPMPHYRISKADIVEHFPALLNALQSCAGDVAPDVLRELLKEKLGDLCPHLSIFPPD